MARAGFTLIEIAVALGIVALMTALLLPVVGDRLNDAGASRIAVQLSNVQAAAGGFHIDVGRWPRQLSQLVDAPGTGDAGRDDVFGAPIPPGEAASWRGPYLNAAALPGDSLDLGRRGAIVSPFIVSDWAGDDFFTIAARGVSRADAVRVSELVDGDTTLAIGTRGGGRVRWEDGMLFYLAEPVRR